MSSKIRPHFSQFVLPHTDYHPKINGHIKSKWQELWDIPENKLYRVKPRVGTVGGAAPRRRGDNVVLTRAHIGHTYLISVTLDVGFKTLRLLGNVGMKQYLRQTRMPCQPYVISMYRYVIVTPSNRSMYIHVSHSFHIVNLHHITDSSYNSLLVVM